MRPRLSAASSLTYLSVAPRPATARLQFNMQLDILEDYLNMRGYKYSRLDGSTNRVQRMIDIKVPTGRTCPAAVHVCRLMCRGANACLQACALVFAVCPMPH